MLKAGLALLLGLFSLAGLSCAGHPAPDTVVVLIESSPANLDPRIGQDSQSERIDELLFDSLVRKDEHFDLHPSVAASWENPDPRTYIFHLRRDIHFHDGRPLTARDVKWTLDSLIHGAILSPKAGAYRRVDAVDAPDEYTVRIHLHEPDATLLWNLSDGALGIVPDGSGKDFSRHPVGSGPFRFVRLDPDSQVVIERNDGYWGERARVPRVRFAVAPDTTTRALELRHGSGDIVLNALTADMVDVLRREPNLKVLDRPGTALAYLAFNLRDPILKDVRVRQAIAQAINRPPMLRYLFGGAGRLADSILPPEHWAYNGDVERYPYSPSEANVLLDRGGYVRGKDGVRFHLAMKTSTEETTRLLAAVLQQQLREVGIALDIRSLEFATFFADVQKGAFQLYSLRWVGGSNQDPDILESVFASASFAPKRANRGYYSNPLIDQLVAEGRQTIDQGERRRIYSEAQRILAHDLPYIDLWYLDNVLVYSTRVRHIQLGPAGNFDFLTTVELER